MARQPKYASARTHYGRLATEHRVTYPGTRVTDCGVDFSRWSVAWYDTPTDRENARCWRCFPRVKLVDDRVTDLADVRRRKGA